MSEDLTTVKNAICTFCGCVSDDIDLTVGRSTVKPERSPRRRPLANWGARGFWNIGERTAQPR